MCNIKRLFGQLYCTLWVDIGPIRDHLVCAKVASTIRVHVIGADAEMIIANVSENVGKIFSCFASDEHSVLVQDASVELT